MDFKEAKAFILKECEGLSGDERVDGKCSLVNVQLCGMKGGSLVIGTAIHLEYGRVAHIWVETSKGEIWDVLEDYYSEHIKDGRARSSFNPEALAQMGDLTRYIHRTGFNYIEYWRRERKV